MLWWYRFSKIDRIVLAVATATLLLSSLLIVEDQWLFNLVSSDTEHLESIGEVKTAVSDVRRRHKTAFSWLPLDEDQEVYQGDSIFTGSQSEALITTARGEQIAISPNSLVVINAKTDSIRLDINYGSIRGQVGKNQKLLVASGGDVTEFRGDDALVKVDVASGKNLVVNVIEGQVEVSSETGTRIIGPQQAAQIGESGTILEPEDVRIDLLTPVPERVIKPDEKGDLLLTWKSSYPFGEFNVEMSTDRDFKQILFKEKTTRNLLKPPEMPSNKKVYWRVSARLKPGARPSVSPISTFTVADDSPPELIFPRDNMRLTFEDQMGDGAGTLNVIFRWNATAASKRWEVQLAKSPDFSQNIQTLIATENYIDSGPLTDGSYFIRVRAKDWANAEWSDTNAFRIIRKSPTSLVAPRATVTSEEFKLVTKLGQYSATELQQVSGNQLATYLEAIPQLTWNPIPGAVGYEIEISTSRTFETVVLRQTVPDAQFGWQNVRVGQFFWRMRSLNSANKRGPYSSVIPLVIKLAPPRNLTDEKVIEEVSDLRQMETPPAPFLLRWSPTLYTSTYELEFDQAPDFKKPLKAVTGNAFKKVQTAAAGVYYWRVRSLGSDGKPVTDFSDSYKYEFAKVYKNPEMSRELKALQPNQDETIVLIGKGDIQITFRWVKPIQNGKYRIQISEHPDFKTTKVNSVTTTDFYIFNGRMNEGWYYWRVRVETDKFTSPWTTAYQFQMKRVVEAFNFKVSEKRLEEQRRLDDVEKRRIEETSKAKLGPQTSFELVAPRGLRSLVNFELGSAVPTFEWDPSENAHRYRVEIATDEAFTNLVESEIVSRSGFKWITAKPGDFYWRVRAEDERNRRSPYSAMDIVKVKSVPPKPTTANTILLKSAGEELYFDWGKWR